MEALDYLLTKFTFNAIFHLNLSFECDTNKIMPTIKLEKKKNSGRPFAEIDWNTVEQLLESGCSGAQIAGFFGVVPATLYERCKTDKGIQFSSLSQHFSSKGEALLTKAQYDKAIGKSDQGDNTLLIWLGKCRLKQSENIQTSSDVKVTVIDYSKSESESTNDSPQISTAEISTSCSESS